MRTLLFSVLTVLVSLPGFAQEHQKYFYELRGMEDSTATSHLFYRFFSSNTSEPASNNPQYSNHIYHYDTSTDQDSVFFKSERRYTNFYGAHNLTGDYLFINNDINKPFWVSFRDDEWSNSYYYIFGYNGSFFHGGFNRITSFSLTETDSSKVVIANISLASAFITLNSDTLPSIDYPYAILVKPISSDEDECFESRESPCIYGKSDSVSFFDYSSLKFNGDQDSVNFLQKNDSLFTTKNPGEEITFYNSDLQWSSVNTITELSDDRYLLANTDTREFILNRENHFDSSSVYISSDSGKNWDVIFSDTNRVYTTTGLGDLKVYIGSGNKIYLWDQSASMSILYESTHTIKGLYKKPDSELLYVLTTDELFELNIESGTTTSLKTLPVSSEPEPTDLPNQVVLHQNYPNPFNPSTVIRYQLPVSSVVSLKLFDILGREVAVLVDGKVNAGSHQVTFNAYGLSSGVYFYRLETTGFVDTKQFTLIK